MQHAYSVDAEVAGETEVGRADDDVGAAVLESATAETAPQISSIDEFASHPSTSNIHSSSYLSGACNHPPTTTTQLPPTTINLPISDDDDQTNASSITSAFRDAELFVSSLYPSTRVLDEAINHHQQPEEPPARSESRIAGHPTTSILPTTTTPVTQTLPDMEANILRKKASAEGEIAGNPTKSIPRTPLTAETLPAMEANILGKKASAILSTGNGESINKTTEGQQRHYTQSTTLWASNNRHNPPTNGQSSSDTYFLQSKIQALHKEEAPPEGLEELGRIELSVLKPEALINGDSSSINHSQQQQMGDNLAAHYNLCTTETGTTGIMAPQEDVLSGIMPIPSERITTEIPMGPGAYPITTPASGWNHFSQSSEEPTTVEILGPEESNEDTESYYGNNDVGLAEAQPVDALPEAQIEEELRNQQQTQKGSRGSFLVFITGLSKPWRYLLMVAFAAIIAGWFMFMMRKYVCVGDPAMIRIRQSIEEVFGKDYFDSHLKEKALHWIVYKDPLKDLAVKQDLQHEAETTRLIQRFSLVAFYFQTSARQPWSDCNPPQGKQSDICYHEEHQKRMSEERGMRWLSASHECQWMGVNCEGGAKTVSLLRLANFNMTGHVPSELSKLSTLNTLDLSLNNLTGSLPLWINQLPSIEKLQLGYNSFTGGIPSSIFSIRSLSFLSLDSNRLSGQLPSQIGLFRGRFLNLQENSLFGPIPDEIYQLSNLQYLYLCQNKLTGTISTLVGQLSKLNEFTLNHCHLRGTIPGEVGYLESLRYLNLTATSVEGTIPEELYNLKSLRGLDVSNTNIGGTISSRIGQLAELEEFYMANTGIRGTIPKQVSRLSKLRLFHANGNPKLSGSIPSEFCTNKFQHYDTVVDCSPSSSTGVPAVMCPKGCCSCCDVETKTCS